MSQLPQASYFNVILPFTEHISDSKDDENTGSNAVSMLNYLVSCHNTLVADTTKKSTKSKTKFSTKSTIHKTQSAAALSYHPYDGTNCDIYELLISFISSETATILQDFVDTDEALMNSNNIVAIMNDKNSDTSNVDSKNNGCRNDSDNNKSTVVGNANKMTDVAVTNETNTESTNKNDAVPIAELILSSHAILLLQTLTVITISHPAVAADTTNDKSKCLDMTLPIHNKKVDNSKSTDKLNNATATNETQQAQQQTEEVEVLLYDLRCRLPRQSYWLFIRILTAFTQLQMQVGLLIVLLF